MNQNEQYGQPSPHDGGPGGPPQPRGLGIASMVLGIISIIFPVFIGLIIGIVAIILAIASFNMGQKNGFATAGLVTGIVGTVLNGIIILACGSFAACFALPFF